MSKAKPRAATAQMSHSVVVSARVPAGGEEGLVSDMGTDATSGSHRAAGLIPSRGCDYALHVLPTSHRALFLFGNSGSGP